jgi:hypothetical protein
MIDPPRLVYHTALLDDADVHFIEVSDSVGTAWRERAAEDDSNEETQFNSGNLRCGRAHGDDDPVCFGLRRQLWRWSWWRRCYVQSTAYANPNANQALNLQEAGISPGSL